MIDVFRRLAPVGLIVAACLCGGARAEAETVPAPIGFVIKRDGNPIGVHRLAFHREPGPDGERLIVDITIHVEVSIAFVTVYRYTFTGRETWQGGRLLAFDSATDDHGTKLTVHVHATPAGLEVDGPGGRYTAPADTLTDSYWRPDTVAHQHFIDIEDGRLIDLVSTPAGHRTVSVRGKPVDLAVYALSGETTGELGYGDDGQWMLLHFPSHGSDILYTREP